MKVLVTGGAGFIGSNYVKSRFQGNMSGDLEIVVLDKLTYAGSVSNLEFIEPINRLKFVQGDICDSALVEELTKDVNQIIHFAAETHVDNSIASSEEFVRTNILGTNVLLNSIKEKPEVTFLHVSTDEVYGSIKEGSWDEESPLIPNSPYSASKAASDLLALAYQKTYNLDIRISRCCNNFGPNQYPEKVIPLFISNLIRSKKLPIYGSGANYREWIHVDDHNAALNLILEKGKAGEIYNIGSGFEINNYNLAQKIIEIFGESKDLIEFVDDRPGHDFRYSLNTSKASKELGFKCKISFEEGLLETINWYKNNLNWWKTKVKA